MLGPGRYLLGVLEVFWLTGFAALGATAFRKRLVPDFTGASSLLATLVLAAALLIWPAELLGTFGAFESVPYLALVGVLGVSAWWFLRRVAGDEGGRERTLDVSTLIALAIAAIAVIHFAAGVRTRLGTGMTGFDSTWYHGPFAAGFFQSGNTWDLHYIAPQFLAWFYPANGEIFHSAGKLAFDRDLLSPLLNLGWLLGCLLACWAIGRAYGVGPWSLALGAIALSVPALGDQAGEARNDIVGIFFLLAGVALALNAWAARPGGRAGLSTGTLAVIGLAAGLACGTKLNFLLPSAVLVFGLVAIAPRGGRGRALAATGLAAVAGGGYWYLRNLAHTGNPLPWFDHLGPISLPAPAQELGGRQTHSVLSYLGDGSVWSDWFLPGLHHGLWAIWPLLLVLAAAGIGLCLGRRSSPILRVAAVSALGVSLAWLVAPTSASGPDGMPSGFESGLRYLAPALILGLALLPTAPALRDRLSGLSNLRSYFVPHTGKKYDLNRFGGARATSVAIALLVTLLCVAVGYPVQRHYLKGRYSDPSFAAPGLNAAFAWARNVSDAHIATTSTRQYPLFGTDLSNDVQFVGEERPHGGFVAPSSCRAWRRLLDEGDYDYVVASRDRVEPGKPPYPPAAGWTEGPGATVVLRKQPTIVFRLRGPLSPAGCPAKAGR
jgi:hypothetical protein